MDKTPAPQTPAPASPPTSAEPVVKPLEPQPTPKKKGLPKWLKILLIFLGSLLLLIIIAGAVVAALVVPPAKKLQQTLPQIQQQVNNLKTGAKEKNLSTIKTELTNLNDSLNTIDEVVDSTSWAQKIPKINQYWSDARHLSLAGRSLIQGAQIGVDALIPYADLAGFTVDPSLKPSLTPSPEASESADSTNEPQLDQTSDTVPETPATAQDRLQFVVNTLDKIVPQLDSISEKLNSANQELSQIDPQRYPEEFHGIAIRSQLTQIIDLTSQAKLLITDARPILQVAPYILGNDKPRHYLVLFQNDAELRPTGGFLTAYALLTVDKGQITPGISKDIYDLDAKYTSKTLAPEPLIKYIPDPYAKEKAQGVTPKLRIRDSNLSPDFKQSMDAFYQEYRQTGSPEIDGIIGVDTQLLLSLLKVTGPIGVGGEGNFSPEIIPECNCPQVVHYLESSISYETNYIRENRKAIIGPLMHSILANAMGTPKDKISQLVQAGLDAIQQKHLLVYYLDPEVQQAIESFNMGGRVVDTNHDYLMIVDTNFAGAKSNLYIEEQVDLNITTSDNAAVHELTITYKNPQPHDGWLNGDYRDWVRVFVPQGSQLLEDSGSETDIITSEDLGKTVFEGFLVTRPEGLSKLTLKYQTPLDQTDPYQLKIQKQGGAKNFNYIVNVNGQTQKFELNGDQDLTFNP